MEDEKSELRRQDGFAEFEFRFWFRIDKKMRGFVLGNTKSEFGRQDGFAESEVKSWLSMDMKM